MKKLVISFNKKIIYYVLCLTSITDSRTEVNGRTVPQEEEIISDDKRGNIDDIAVCTNRFKSKCEAAQKTGRENLDANSQETEAEQFETTKHKVAMEKGMFFFLYCLH